MTDIAELEPRVQALEAAQNDSTQTLRWVVAKLAQMSALQNEHTLRLEGMDTRLERMDSRLDKIDSRLDYSERESAEWRRKLPEIIAETMREVLREQKS